MPAIAEAGVPYYKINAFHGFLAPAGTPPAIVAKFDRDLPVWKDVVEKSGAKAE